MITHEISHIFCVQKRWNFSNYPILTAWNLRLKIAKFCEAGLIILKNFYPTDFQNSLVFDLEIILIFHPHYHTHSGNTSQPVNLAVVRWLVSYEDENEYDNDNGNEIED